MIMQSRRVVLGDEIVPAAIEIEAPHVVAVHRTDTPVAGAVDFGERLVAPAFVNAHTHLALGFVRGFDMRAATRGNMVEEVFFRIEERMSAADVRAFAVMGAYESLLCGVGLVWDHYYHADEIAGALGDVGLAGVVAPTLQDLSGPGRGAWEAQLDATLRIDRSDLGERGIFAAFGPHATDTVSPALFERIAEMSAAEGLPVHVHVAQSIEEVRRIRERHDTTPVGLLERTGILDAAPSTAMAHCVYVGEPDLQRLGGGKHHPIWCPYSALVFGFPARPGWWSALGLPWAVATDCASNNDTMNVQQELRMVAAQRTVGASWSGTYEQMLAGAAPVDDNATASWERRMALFDEHDALAAPAALLDRVWGTPGRLHPKLRAGVIAPGALANLLVFDLDHPSMWPAHDPLAVLAMADAARGIWAMYVAGREIGEAGNFERSILESEAYAAARREASDRLAKLRL